MTKMEFVTSFTLALDSIYIPTAAVTNKALLPHAEHNLLCLETGRLTGRTKYRQQLPSVGNKSNVVMAQIRDMGEATLLLFVKGATTSLQTEDVLH